MAALFLVCGTAALRAANLDRISAETGVPVATLQAERTSTGFGWGELENAHLLANALAAQGSNLTFNDLVAMHQAGEGWGKIAHDNGLNLGRIVSAAHRSSRATAHAQNLTTTHGKKTAVHGKSTAIHGRSATNVGKSRTTRSAGRAWGLRSGLSGFHGTHSMGHMGGFHSMGSMGHGGGHGR